MAGTMDRSILIRDVGNDLAYLWNGERIGNGTLYIFLLGIGIGSQYKTWSGNGIGLLYTKFWNVDTTGYLCPGIHILGIISICGKPFYTSDEGLLIFFKSQLQNFCYQAELHATLPHCAYLFMIFITA